jgi:hypothetical protein
MLLVPAASPKGGAVMNALTSGLMAETALVSHVRLDPDAKLIATCAKFDALERRYIALVTAAGDAEERGEDPDSIEAEYNRVMDQGDPVVARIEKMPPVTLVGAQALAATIALENPELLRRPCDRSGQLIKTLLRGLLGEHRS